MQEYVLLLAILSQGHGLIVATTFWDRDRYLRGNLYYDLAKAAINRLAFGVAQELRPHGVASLAVSPGWMRTELVLAGQGLALLRVHRRELLVEISAFGAQRGAGAGQRRPARAAGFLPHGRPRMGRQRIEGRRHAGGSFGHRQSAKGRQRPSCAKYESDVWIRGEYGIEVESFFLLVQSKKFKVESMQNYKDLQVWKKSHELTLEIYKVTKSFPKEEIFALVSQLRRASASIPTNIAEGSGRFTKKDFASFLQISLGSAQEVEYLILLSKRKNIEFCLCFVFFLCQFGHLIFGAILL